MASNNTILLGLGLVTIAVVVGIKASQKKNPGGGGDGGTGPKYGVGKFLEFWEGPDYSQWQVEEISQSEDGTWWYMVRRLEDRFRTSWRIVSVDNDPRWKLIQL